MCVCLCGTNELDSLLLLYMFLFVRAVSEDAGSPAASASGCVQGLIGVCALISAPTAVPETEESDEALFCRVRVTAGVVCTG